MRKYSTKNKHPWRKKNDESLEFSDRNIDEKIEKENSELLNKVLSGNLISKRDKVGFILNNNTSARNSDIELAWSYWKTFECSLPYHDRLLINLVCILL
ncbi:hypothetical protein ZORO111903_05360 [Zobellia roscoffensis]